MKYTAIALLFALVSTIPAGAQQFTDLSGYNLVLVPVFFFGPGGHGSQWETSVRVWTTTQSQRDVLMPFPLLDDRASVQCIDLTNSIGSFHSTIVCPDYSSPSGLLLYIPQSLDPHDLQVNVRIRDLTRTAESGGTDIPVVKESEFRWDDFVLTNIPSDSRFRANLRIYGLIERFGLDHRYTLMQGNVRFEIFDSRDLDLVTPLAQATVKLNPPERMPATYFLPDPSSYYLRPAFASIGDLVATFPQLANVPSYTIRVHQLANSFDPPREDSIWAFVTLTNNDTQQVTTIAP